MSKQLRWQMFFILNAIFIGLLVLFSVTEKVLKGENIEETKNKIEGSTALEKSWFRLVYKVLVDEREDRPRIIKEIIEVLKKRIYPEDGIEYKIQEYDINKILVQVCATKTEIETLKRRFARLGKLEFRLCKSEDTLEHRDAIEGNQVPGYYKHWLRKKKGEIVDGGKWFLVKDKIEISGEHLERVYPDVKGIEPIIGFEFDADSKSKFGKITERNIGNPLAIIMDDILYSAPTIRDRIDGTGIIEGNFSQQEVYDLITVLRSGCLPAKIELEMEIREPPNENKEAK